MKTKFTITDEMKIKVRKRLSKFYFSSEKRRTGIVSNKSHVFTKNFLYFGFMGECVFEEFLKTNDFLYIKDRVVGNSDKFDFKVGGRTIDVKTTSFKGKYPLLLITVESFKRKQYDFYVLVVINGDIGEVKGFATKDEVNNAEIKNFGYIDDYTIQSLHSMTNFLKKKNSLYQTTL